MYKIKTRLTDIENRLGASVALSGLENSDLEKLEYWKFSMHSVWWWDRYINDVFVQNKHNLARGKQKQVN